MSASLNSPLRSMFAAAIAGFAGLVTQIVWTRFAIAFFGASSTTIASVLAVSLAGLAMGSWWASRFNPRLSVRSAGRWAGSLLLIACGAIVLAVLIASRVENVLSFSDSQWMLLAKQILTHCLAIGILNFCLGAIVPLLIAATGSEKTGLLSLLYASETIGGASGALFAGFYSIQTLGLNSTLWIAAGTTVIAGALWLVRNPKASDSKTETRTEESSAGNSPANSAVAGSAVPIMIAVMLAGCASLGLEIVWQRLLVLILGTDTHSYTVVAFGYLTGLAVGAFLSGIWLRFQADRPDRSAALFTVLQMLLACATVGVLMAFCHLASGAGQRWLGEAMWGEPSPLLKRFVFCTGLLLIPTTLIGASFPVAVHAIESAGQSLSRRTGRLYACAAIGNVLGILLAGFLFVPNLGLQATVIGYGVVSMVAGGVALFQRSPTLASGKQNRWRVGFRYGLPAGLAAIAIVISGYHLSDIQPVGIAVEPPNDLKWYREGPVNTVAVLANDQDPLQRQVVVDGIIIGQSGGGVEEKQHMLAQLPFLLRQREQDHQVRCNVLTIGLGSGLLAGEVAGLSDVESIVAIELSPSVIEASKYFSDLIPADAASRLSIVQGDGIFYLRTSDTSFDAIISDGKSRPGHAGNVAFFSREYYRHAASRLAEGGVFVQWYSLEGSREELQSVLRSFADTFEHGYVALAPPDSVYLIGTSEPLGVNPIAMKQYFDRSESGSLRKSFWSSVDDIRSMGWLVANDVAEKLPDDVLPNTLRHPVLERFALDIHRQSSKDNKLANLDFLESLVADPKVARAPFVLSQDRTRESVDKATLAIIRSAKIQLKSEPYWLDQSADQFALALKELPELNRGAILANFFFLAAEKYREAGNAQGYSAAILRAAKLKPDDARLQFAAASELQRTGQLEDALSLFYRVTKLDDSKSSYFASFGIVLVQSGKFGRAQQALEKAIELDDQNANAWLGLGFLETQRGNPAAAERHYLKAQELDPRLAAP